MGSKDETVTGITAESKRKIYINTILFFLMFVCYALTFLVPKFYGVTDRYASLFIFCICTVLFFNNVDWISLIRHKDKEIWILAAVVLLTGINLIVIGSNKGCFFVAANFALVWYLGDKILLTKKQIKALSIAYFVLLLLWYFIAYPIFFSDYGQMAYNTNTAATFTVFTMICTYGILKEWYHKKELAGLILVIVLVRTVQLVVWHRARGAFIMLLAFLFFYYAASRKWWDSKKIMNVFFYILTLGSLVFVALYTTIGQLGVNFQLPFFYKNVFSGRQNIWLEVGKMFIKQPITGIGSGYTLNTFIEYNLHNAMYDLIAVHGILVFAGILIIVYKRFQGFRSISCKNEMVVCALCAVLAVFLESFFDVDLIWADYAPNMLFLLTMIRAGKEQTIRET
ncbi:MAG: hypothetical protein Q4G60_04325 [bacterium]|nr:hypothetical protein [bacterium]